MSSRGLVKRRTTDSAVPPTEFVRSHYRSITSRNKLCLFVQAVLDVVGRSNANRRHVDRRGCPIYVVTDFYTVGQTDRERHAPEIRALTERAKRAKATQEKPR